MKSTLSNFDAEATEKPFANNDVLALLLAPSRELAMQTAKVLSLFVPVLAPHMNFCYFIGGDKLEYDL